MRKSYRAVAAGILATGLASAAAPAETTNYVYFFHADHDAYRAYLDLNNQSVDASGYKLVNVMIDTFSPAYRDWINKNFPGAESAIYAIDPYSVDCAHRKVGEHDINFYGKSGASLADYDFGGTMTEPAPGTMKAGILKRECGF